MLPSTRRAPSSTLTPALRARRPSERGRRPTLTTTWSTASDVVPPSGPSNTTVELVRAVDARDATAGLHLDAAPLEPAADGLGDLLVDAGEDLRQHLEERDLGADVDEERRELAADRAAADRPHARRDRLQLEHVVGRRGRARRRTRGPGSHARDEPVARISDVARELGAVGDADAVARRRRPRCRARGP